ncbi:AI-2E family transporter [Rubripirellula reticaptiva]|uniref:AI-2 transport protein TqsA n=1 Tax=Rubripirellula reticaptiva TaxID=2528013 RepID=A0A5C6EUI2_9BACT|nr:AI-2E family transporter [Rubripirellula reticaptiva]TWU51256.1 AI-2 transport protein TqsA [Rubripirellula reticaptiva]
MEMNRIDTERDAGRFDQQDGVYYSRHRVRLDQPPLTENQSTSPWVILIAIVLLLGAFYIASSLLVPLTISALAYLTLRPITAWLCGFGLSQPIAAGIIIAGFFSIIAVIATLMYDPLQSWMTTAPESVGMLKDNFDSVVQPLTAIDRAEESLGEAGEQIGAERPPVEVKLEKPSIINPAYLVNTTGHLLAFISAIAVLTFFMLSSGDDLLNRALNVLPDEQKREEVLVKIRNVQDNVGSYLGYVTLINAGLGVAVSIVMWLVGMPTPILWGVMAALLNFIPYIGPIGGTVIVLVAAGSVFDSFPRAMATAAAFWLTTAVEGQFVTPTVVGKSLKVGSLVVLIAVAFWGFLWGSPGIFLAVPLLIVQRVVFSSFPATLPIAVVLGEEACKPGEDCEFVQDDKPIAECV